MRRQGLNLALTTHCQVFFVTILVMSSLLSSESIP